MYCINLACINLACTRCYLHGMLTLIYSMCPPLKHSVNNAGLITDRINVKCPVKCMLLCLSNVFAKAVNYIRLNK